MPLSADTTTDSAGVLVGWNLNKDTASGDLRALRYEMARFAQAMLDREEQTITVLPVAAPASAVIFTAPPGSTIVSPDGTTTVVGALVAAAEEEEPEDEDVFAAFLGQDDDEEPLLSRRSLIKLFSLGLLTAMAVTAAILKRALLASLASAGFGYVTGKRGKGGDSSD